MNGFFGSQVRDPNFRLRFFVIIFLGIIVFGVILSWRSTLLFVSEYQDMPVTAQQLKIKKQNQQIRERMQNKLFPYQIEE